MPKLREQVAQQPPAKGTVKYGHYPEKRFHRNADDEIEENNLFITDDFLEENDLFITDDLLEGDESFYPSRQPDSVVRRYYVPSTEQNRTATRVTRQTRPPVTPHTSRNTILRQKLQVNRKPVKRKVQEHKSWLFYIGSGMLASVALWIAGSTTFSWLQAEHDNLTYGTPHTFQVDANVGHQGTSHFICENLHGDIIVMEIHLANLAETKIYQGPIFSGPGTDDLVATLSFKDVNADGKPDMVISVGNGRYVLINTGNDFRPTTSSDYIDGI